MIDRKKVEKALGPVWDWYQSDEHEDRPVEDILRDVSADLQKDRGVVLRIRGSLSTVMLQLQHGIATREGLERFCRDTWEISK